MPTTSKPTIDREKAVRLAQLFKCLADPNRLIILNVILQGGKKGGRVPAMVTATGLPRPTVRDYLHKLRDHGFIATTTTEPSGQAGGQGRLNVWHIEPTALNEVQEGLKLLQDRAGK